MASSMSTFDSMSVWAEHRIPGTTSYDFFISKTLHSNVPSTSPPWSVWTPVTMTAPGDQIQWLSFNGGIAIDNLKIVRKPLRCTPATVVRGQTVSCVVVNQSYNVTKWEFRADDGGVAMAAARSSSASDNGVELLNSAPSTPATIEWVYSSKTWGRACSSRRAGDRVPDGCEWRPAQLHNQGRCGGTDV